MPISPRAIAVDTVKDNISAVEEQLVKQLEIQLYNLQPNMPPEDLKNEAGRIFKRLIENKFLIEESSEPTNIGGSKMFKIAYHDGDTLDSSYFIGTIPETGEALVVKAAEIMPEEVKKAISESEAKGIEAPEIITPEEAIAQIQAAGVDSIDGFKKWAEVIKASFVKKADAPVPAVEAAPAVEMAPVTEPELKTVPLEAAAGTEPAAEAGTGAEVSSTAKPGMEKKAAAAEAGTWSMDKSEVKPEKLPPAGEVISSIDKKEAAAEEVNLPKEQTSKTRSYYGRLPGKGSGQPDAWSVNKESAVNEKYQFAIKALSELKTRNAELEKTVNVLTDEKKKVEDGKQNVEKELGKVKDELEVDKKKGEADKVLATLKTELGLKGDEEKAVLDILVKFDPKSLKLVADLVKALFEAEGPKGEAKKPAFPPMPPMKSAAAAEGVLFGENLPQVGSVTGNESGSLIETVEKMFDHN